jgi:hypothetical protein
MPAQCVIVFYGYFCSPVLAALNFGSSRITGDMAIYLAPWLVQVRVLEPTKIPLIRDEPKFLDKIEDLNLPSYLGRIFFAFSFERFT